MYKHIKSSKVKENNHAVLIIVVYETEKNENKLTKLLYGLTILMYSSYL